MVLGSVSHVMAKSRLMQERSERLRPGFVRANAEDQNFHAVIDDRVDTTYYIRRIQPALYALHIL